MSIGSSKNIICKTFISYISQIICILSILEHFFDYDVSGNQYYELGNKNVTLFQLNSRYQFSVCSEPLIDIFEVSATKKSLREIANAQSLSGGQGFK